MTFSTSRPIAAEIFSALQAYSEVHDAGLQFVKERSEKTGQEADSLFLEFQARIRQAKTFYTSAETLHHRASPLFFYYAFMNLAWAYLCLKAPDLVLEVRSNIKKLHHGLTVPMAAGPFEDQCSVVQCTARRPGVFSELYRGLTGVELCGTGPGRLSLKLVDMFRYASDISGDYYERKDNTAYARGRSKLIVGPSSKDCWTVVATPSGLLESDAAALAQFFTEFQQVEVPIAGAMEFFDVNAGDFPHWRFYQSHRSFSNLDSTSSQQYWLALKPVFDHFIGFTWPFDEGYQCAVNKPLGSHHEYPWHEFYANYVSFFHLGSLVRYNAGYLEQLLGTRAGWLIEQFAHSAPLTVLRHFVPVILDKAYIFIPR